MKRVLISSALALAIIAPAVNVHAAKATYLVRASLKKAFQQFRQYGYFKV